ncbi:hypothetical protein P389DRAFT_82599 [Cystobasidium minutum MCA 4210]|uniref:uncharacterized protein n=1 Tax=Cystobasidium minutum MCA 4210 TaxID=1397322 RepID=UPI0034CED1D2|eukprot:jgi/Rhomi1/82599/CE82598_289
MQARSPAIRYDVRREELTQAFVDLRENTFHKEDPHLMELLCDLCFLCDLSMVQGSKNQARNQASNEDKARKLEDPRDKLRKILMKYSSSALPEERAIRIVQALHTALSCRMNEQEGNHEFVLAARKLTDAVKAAWEKKYGCSANSRIAPERMKILLELVKEYGVSSNPQLIRDRFGEQVQPNLDRSEVKQLQAYMMHAKKAGASDGNPPVPSGTRSPSRGRSGATSLSRSKSATPAGVASQGTRTQSRSPSQGTPSRRQSPSPSQREALRGMDWEARIEASEQRATALSEASSELYYADPSRGLTSSNRQGPARRPTSHKTESGSDNDFDSIEGWAEREKAKMEGKHRSPSRGSRASH